jgi:hypothetical protein
MNPEFMRAVYVPADDFYVSTYADWFDGAPTLYYRFHAFEPVVDDGLWEGVLEKHWHDPGEGWLVEDLVFGYFTDESAFQSDVAAIRAEAKKRAEAENVDTLLLIIDMLKERAVDADIADEAVLDMDGWFEGGLEDAYTWRDVWSDNRLHHHVERDNECWRFHVGKVNDTDGTLLGWGLFVVHFPGLLSAAANEEIEATTHGRIILINHCGTELEARLGLRGTAYFMEEGDRVDDPGYAFMNDTEVLSGLAVAPTLDEQTGDVLWLEYRDQGLHDFLSGKGTFVCPREQWQPPEKTPLDRFFEVHPQSVWVEDQLRTMLEEWTGTTSDFEPDSPWQEYETD